ncbi:MAG TPA: HEAT repeat domain-containing protein [Pirellulales bacterium]|nr:HEAT repeat domain-containing protein [Pirellulales bacterium]
MKIYLDDDSAAGLLVRLLRQAGHDVQRPDPRWAMLLVLGIAVHVASAAEPQPPFRVPPGFEVEQVAAPPLVRYPLFAEFDDRGRLFVAEGTGTNLPGEELAKRKLGRIVLVEDTDGDGRFDASHVFADELVFPQGVLWHDGALYAASHPSIWKLEDPAATGVATRRTELATGFNFNGNGCDIHGPFLGPDGRLYWTDGRHGYKLKTREGTYLEGLASRVWRARTDGGEIERLCGGGFDNPVEIAFTPEGDAIGTMDQGTGDCLLHYVEGAVYPMEHPCLAEFPMTGPLMGAVRQYTPVLPAALCGLTAYRSAVFGPEYQDTLFATHFMLHRIVQNTLVREGSTYRADEQEFLVCADHNMRLTDVLEDADGSLLFVDMGAWFNYGFPGNPLPRPESLGGIYRVRRADAKAVDDPWGKKLDNSRRSPAELASLLDDPRPRVRDLAIAALAKRGDMAVATLDAVAGKPGTWSVEARRNAIWSLCRIGTPAARPALRRALADCEMSIRLAAAHAAGLERDVEASAELVRLVTSDEPPVRLKAAEALGRIGQSAAVPNLLAGLQLGGDRFLEHAIIFALIRINDREATLPALAHADPRVRQGGLIALDQMPDGRLTRDDVAPLLDSDDADLQRAALDVVSKRPAWADVTQYVLRKWLSAADLAADRERSLVAVLMAFAGEENIQRLVAHALAEPGTEPARRLLLLNVVARSRVEPLPASWLAALGRSLDDSDLDIRGAAVETLKTRKIGQFDDALAQLGRDDALPVDLRIAALECLAQRRQQLDSEAFALLSGQLSETAEPRVRLAAARVLGASGLSGDQQTELTAALPGVNTMVLRLLLPIFSKTGEARVGTSLVDALTHSPAAEALRVDELDKSLSAFTAEVRKRADALRRKLIARQQDQAAYLAKLAAELEQLPASAEAGQPIFLSQKAGCYGCHRAVGRGGTVGPDLSKIGQIRNKAELLESIVFPSSIVNPEYRSFQVVTNDGQIASGLLIRDAPEAIYLRTTELAEIRIPRDDIEQVSPLTVSVMPDGLEKTLSRQELRDLLEFLTQQK